ncbi:MAG: glycogen synthase, partial [Thermodesulfobacteriota bacterium]
MLNVLFVASEMDPFVKVGGLADVIGSLPKKIKENDCQIKIIIPHYKTVENSLNELNIKKKRIDKEIHVRTNSVDYIFEVNETEVNGIQVYFLQNKELFDRDFVYSTPQGDYADNFVRYGAFSLAALKAAHLIKFKPDIIHCHDWHTSFIPIYLKNTRNMLSELSFFKDSKIVYTIHNIAYQGVYDSFVLNVLGFPNYIFSQEGIEYYGKINLMKGGIIYSDLVTTVSPTYCEEIKTPSQGKGLEGVIKNVSERSNKLVGILNGIDYEKWDPQTDKYINQTYSSKTIHLKALNKQELKKQLDLEEPPQKPLIGLVCRLAEQKGIDLVVESLDIIFDLGFQVVIIGSGEERYINMLNNANEKYAGNIRALLKYNDKFARKIFAASDMFLMPSRFEPCGLTQIIALRYGSIPIVRATGGLVDTIFDYTRSKKNGNGFVFENFSIASLIDSLKRALSVYRKEKEWNNLVERGM